MREMNGSVTKSFVAFSVIALLIVTGFVFSIAGEKANIAKAVFYVA